MDDVAPNAEIATQSQPLDLSSAAALLTRADAPTQERAPNGRFAAKQPTATEQPLAIEPDDKVVDLKTGKPPEESVEEPAKAEDDADEFFEFAPEKDGEEPRRVKVDEVLAAYEELPKIKAELENVQKAAPAPPDYVSALTETVQARSQYMQGLQMVEQMIHPQDPPLDLLNQGHPSYDPDKYYALKSRFEQDRQQLATVQAEQKKVAEQQQRDNDVLVRAHVAKERAAIESAWPEFKQPETRKALIDGLTKAYGFTQDEINNIGDHRQLLVIRDALELRASKAKQADAVKVVRSKPKLVKGAARTTTDPKAAQAGQAMQSLASSGSVDAAVRAMAALKL